MKDPTEWMNDLSFYMDDRNVADTAKTIEPTLLYGGSKAAAGAWIGLAGMLGGAFGGVTLSPAIRQPLAFVIYLAAGALVVRGVHLLTVRLLGTRCRLARGARDFLDGAARVLGGARCASGRRLWAYAISLGCGAFIGLMYGAITPGVTRREDLWMMTALPLAPLGSGLATYMLRHMPDLADSLQGAAMTGALAGGLLAVPMGALLARVWDEAQALAQMGLLFLHNPNFAPKAIAYFDRAIAVAPDDAYHYTLRGVAWSRMDEPERADRRLGQGVGAQPGRSGTAPQSWDAPPRSWCDHRGDRLARSGTRAGSGVRARSNVPSAWRSRDRPTSIVRSSITIARSGSTPTTPVRT